MPIVNGHEAETGCYAEGHRGWYVGQRAIELAIDYGFELDAEGLAAVADYYEPPDDGDRGGAMEVVIGQGGIVDEATDWLNDHTSEGFLWHWHDGEFFLSRICEDETTCTDDECAHWD